MPHADGPCSAAKYDARLLGSLLTMKLMLAWRYRSTSLERCRATSVKPSFSNTGSRVLGVGDANSTNSKPISPIGFSNKSAIAVLLISKCAYRRKMQHTKPLKVRQQLR